MRRDEAAYREYVHARLEHLRRSAYLLCRDWNIVDDLVAITIGKLYRHWRRGQQAANLDAYVHGILTHVWLDERRRPWRRGPAVRRVGSPRLAIKDDTPCGLSDSSACRP
jgi:DNA-directed RNA polymerase specialized sigma24 family protein